MKARWTIGASGSQVVLTSGPGIHKPSAISIWEAEFEGRDEVDGFSVAAPSEDLPKLEFLRFPVVISLVAKGSIRSGLRVVLVGMAGDHLVEIPQNAHDQLLIKNSWALIQTDQIEYARDVLLTKNINVSDSINVGQLIWLRGQDRLPVSFIDETLETDASSVVLPRIGTTNLRLGTKLFSYQETGAAFLASVAKESLGCVLADEMGLGKTLQVIALLAIEREVKKVPNLVVCPATLLENWRRELAQFAPSLSVLVHAGQRRTGSPAILREFDVVITSYETAVRDESILSSVDWNILTLDEAQSIKNPDAQRTKTVKALPRRVSIAVTGTPVENRLTDLWSIADFALPDLLGTKDEFEAQFDDTREDASRLEPLISPIVLRRRVADVAKDLPPRIDIPQPIAMTRKMALLYEEIRQEIEEEYGSNGTLVALGKLRQFCAHPSLLGVDWPDPALGMPKYQRLVEILEEIFSRNQKALIFTSFTGMVSLLMQDLTSRFSMAWCGLIDGRVPIPERQPLVDAFTEHPGFGFLALNPKAAGVGLNITAANHVIHYNPEWNPAVEDQASARAYRKKQKLPVTVHRLYFADTVEDVVAQRLDLKRELAAGAVIGHPGSADAAIIARCIKTSPFANMENLE